MMLRRNPQKHIQPMLETFRILLPQLVLQKHAHRVHPDRLGPPELAIDLRRIKRRCLEHLQLIDRIRRHEVRTHQPRLLRIPCIGLRLRPPPLDILSKRRCRERQHHANNPKSLHLSSFRRYPASPIAPSACNRLHLALLFSRCASASLLPSQVEERPLRFAGTGPVDPRTTSFVLITCSRARLLVALSVSRPRNSARNAVAASSRRGTRSVVSAGSV